MATSLCTTCVLVVIGAWFAVDAVMAVFFSWGVAVVGDVVVVACSSRYCCTGVGKLFEKESPICPGGFFRGVCALEDMELSAAPAVR